MGFVRTISSVIITHLDTYMAIVTHTTGTADFAKAALSAAKAKLGIGAGKDTAGDGAQAEENDGGRSTRRLNRQRTGSFVGKLMQSVGLGGMRSKAGPSSVRESAAEKDIGFNRDENFTGVGYINFAEIIVH